AGRFRVDGAGKSEQRELTLVQQERIFTARRKEESSNDIARVVDPHGLSTVDRAGDVDRLEAARVDEKSMLLSGTIHVGTDNLRLIVDVKRRAENRAGE